MWYSHKQDLLHAPIWLILYIKFIKVHLIPIQNNMHCWWIQIKKSPKYILNDNIEKQPFDIIAIPPRGTLGLCCIHIAQLLTHPAVYTLPFTSQLCYKPLGILVILGYFLPFTPLTMQKIKILKKWKSS